ncbi:hypothetical protein C9J85_11650 [Haloferax sp. wsp5]|nr:hypothetical protein C9J85_11650 [Haloferax sp. wsp5]
MLARSCWPRSSSVRRRGGRRSRTGTDSHRQRASAYEYTGSPTTLIVDCSNLESARCSPPYVMTQGGPKDTSDTRRPTANLNEDQLLFFNDGAYESVRHRVGLLRRRTDVRLRERASRRCGPVRTVVGTTGGDSI